MRRCAAAAAALSLLVSGGCALLGTERDECSSPAATASAFPTSTLEDWVTYGDHALVLTGLDEREENGREMVRLRTERTLWSREQAPAAAPAEVFAETHRSRNTAAAEPGHRYLLIGAWWDGDADGKPDWSHVELLAFDDGVVGRGSAACKSTADSGRAAVWDRSEAEVTDLLTRSRPDPRAAAYSDLEPAERYQRVMADGK